MRDTLLVMPYHYDDDKKKGTKKGGSKKGGKK
jgi:hypothetical protein